MGFHLRDKSPRIPARILKRALEDYTDVYIAKWEEYHNVKATYYDKL